MVLIQRSYCVLHAFRRSQDTLKEVAGCYEFNVRVEFCMLSGDPRVP